MRLTHQVVAIGENLFDRARLNEDAGIADNPRDSAQSERRHAKQRIAPNNPVEPGLAYRVARRIGSECVDQDVDVSEDHSICPASLNRPSPAWRRCRPGRSRTPNRLSLCRSAAEPGSAGFPKRALRRCGADRPPTRDLRARPRLAAFAWRADTVGKTDCCSLSHMSRHISRAANTSKRLPRTLPTLLRSWRR